MGVDTVVVGDNPFAFIEVIKRLQLGGAVALLIDRPISSTAVFVDFFGPQFAATIAAAELARASNCIILPVFIVEDQGRYRAHTLAPVEYDRRDLGDRAGRLALTSRILKNFEPVVRQYSTQWFHFVPIWPKTETK
jgi:lauroyl/myristoyl acyltransferase